MRRGFLLLLIGSVAVSSLMGIAALLSGSFGETELKVLLSTLCVAGASILAMACSAAWERNQARTFAGPGIAASILGFLMLLLMLWTESGGEGWAKIATTLVIGGVFCAHASLLLLPRLAENLRWVQPTTIAATAALAALLSLMIWGSERSSDDWRMIGVLAILGSAGTILTAVFQRLGRDPRTTGLASDPPRAPCCPHCGLELPRELLRGS